TSLSILIPYTTLFRSCLYPRLPDHTLSTGVDQLAKFFCPPTVRCEPVACHLGLAPIVRGRCRQPEEPIKYPGIARCVDKEEDQQNDFEHKSFDQADAKHPCDSGYKHQDQPALK